MLQSMTGYGKGEAAYKSRKIIVEIKSLNSKNLDISTHIAPSYLDRELPNAGTTRGEGQSRPIRESGGHRQ